VEGGDTAGETVPDMEGFGPGVQEELWKGGQDGILPARRHLSQPGAVRARLLSGTGFGTRLAGTFLHCDFPAGVTGRSPLKPQGRAMCGTAGKVPWNWLADGRGFGPDGAIYVPIG